MARTLEQVRTELTEWEECLSAIRTSQEYRIGSRWLTRANLPDVYRIVKDLRIEEFRLVRGGSGPRVQKIIPRDS